jgi:hypothetical protein
LSPLVHVTQTPSLVISHLHIPITKLQQQHIMPFIMQQQLHMVPAIVMQRFWRAPAAILSSQEHMIFMPPVHFSNLMVHRGTIMPLIPVGPAGIAVGSPFIAVLAIPMLGTIVALAIVESPVALAASPAEPSGG